MDIVKVGPSKDSVIKTEMTIEMTADEARVFAQALTEGKLAHLGITGASFVKLSEDEPGVMRRTMAEQERRSTPKDLTEPRRG